MKQFKNINKSRGFTIIDMVIVLGVVTILSIGYIQFEASQFRKKTENVNARALTQLSSAAAVYYGENSAWPNDVATLVSTNILPVFSDFNTDGNPYTFVITAPTPAVPKPGLVIETQFQTLASARDVKNAFGNTAQLVGNTVRLAVAVPGLEVSFEHLVHRDGSRDVYGTLEFRNADINMQDNDIYNVKRVTVERPDGTGLVQTDNLDANTATAETFVYNTN